MLRRCARLFPIQVGFRSQSRLLATKLLGDRWPEHERAVWREEQRRFQEKLKVHVSKILSPEFTEEAFLLEVLDRTIWDVIRDDMGVYGGKDRFNTDVDDFLSFMRRYFTDAIVEQVQQHFQFCAPSLLGTEHSFRRGKVELGKIVVHDAANVLAAGPLGLFLGAPSIQAQEDAVDDGTYSLDDYLPERRRIEIRESSCTEDNGACLPFQSLEVAWSSETLGERSALFASKVAAQFPEATCRRRYEHTDFCGGRSGTVNMYQGGLCRELSCPWECITNSLVHAYEHPQHMYPLFSKRPVVVIVFEIDTAVLHGYKPPEDGGPNFTVRSFQNTPDQYAKLYTEVVTRLERRVLPPADIMIMPDCLPRSDGGVVKLVNRMDAGIPLARVMFHSDRAKLWLQNQVKIVIHEVWKDS